MTFSAPEGIVGFLVLVILILMVVYLIRHL